MNFSNRLKQLRQYNKLTQTELADTLHLKPTAISNYESGRNEPSFDKLISLAKYFGVSSDYLLGISDDYLPIGGEVLNLEMIEFFSLYQQLTPENAAELKNYTMYLLHKQTSGEHIGN